MAGTVSREHAVLAARLQREIGEVSEALDAIRDDLGELVGAVDGAPPQDAPNSAKDDFWGAFYNEADAQLKKVTA